MKSILSIYDLLPVLLLVVQTVIIMISTVYVLRYLKILQLPYAGMENRKVVLASTILLSALIISFSDVEALIQAVKTFQQYEENFYKNVFVKFSQFFLVIILAQGLLGLLSFFALKIIPGLKASYPTEDDMPGAIIQGLITIVFAVLLYLCAKEIITTITPKYINFN